MAERRVVMTGTGLVTPLGTGVAKSWKNLCNGVSGVGPITRFDASDDPVQIAAEVTDYTGEDYFEKKELKQLKLFVQYALVATKMALEESGLQISEENCGRIGVITGCGMGGLPTITHQHEVALTKGYKRISPFFVPTAIPNMPSGHISMQTGCKGPNLTLTTACAAGTHAIGEAYRHIKYGMCDAMIAGGTEGVICKMGINGFASMKALSKRNESPAEASRPFDKDRDGFVISEGAGILILEDFEHARARGAQIIGEVVGYGLSSDAFHIAAPPEDGEGAVRSMRFALEDAKLNLADVDYINAHGTSTPLNDRCETIAIKTVFGDHAYRLAVSSTKSMIGHSLGAAGGIEAVILALSLKYQVIPPTINLHQPSPECDLDYVPNTAREAKIKVGLSNSFGFGGTNGVLAFRRFEG